MDQDYRPKDEVVNANSEPVIIEGDVVGSEINGGKLPRKWWESFAWFIFIREWRQLSFAFFITFSIFIFHWFYGDISNISPFDKLSELHSFIFGICSIVTLIASITFGFLIYSAQMVESEKLSLYSHLRSSVHQVRKVLEPLIEQKILSLEVSKKLHAFELIMPSDLPLPLKYWDEITQDLFDEIEHKSPKLEEPERSETLRRVLVALFLAEDTVSSYGVNDVRQGVITLILSRPVYKTFACLAAFLSLLIISAAFETPITFQYFFLATIFLTALSITFIIEIILYAKREMDDKLYRN